MLSDEPKSYTIYVKIAQMVAQFGFITTSFFCYILIFLTVFGVSRNFGSYKYLLIIFPTVGIFFATMEVILYPNVYSHNAGYVFYSTSRPFNLEKDVVRLLLCFYTGIYASTISLLSVQFLYRYWAIFDETKLRFFKGWRFSFSVIYSIVFGIIWAIGILIFDEIDDYSKEYLNAQMIEKYNIDISEVSGMAVVAYDSKGSVRWFNISSTFTMTFVMLVQYTIIIYCAYFMYRGMEEKLKMLSLSLRNLHKQFFKTLILQIVLPTITLFSPVILIIYVPFLDIEADLPTGIFLCAFTLYPAMDAIIVMYIVADYKKAAKKLARKLLEKCNALLGTLDVEPSTTQTGSNAKAAVNNA